MGDPKDRTRRHSSFAILRVVKIELRLSSSQFVTNVFKWLPKKYGSPGRECSTEAFIFEARARSSLIKSHGLAYDRVSG